jgi:hypothetical protein
MPAGADLLTLSPEVSAAPQKWLAKNTRFTPKVLSNVLQAEPGQSTGLMVSIQSSGDYVKPRKMIATATLRSGENRGEKKHTRGAGLGFWSLGPTASGAHITFYGVVLNPDGQVSLFEQQPDERPYWRSNIDWKKELNANWKTAEWYTLRMEVDISPGVSRITSLSINGYKLTLEQKGLFTDSNTRYFGVYLANVPEMQESAAVKEFSLVPAP